MLQPRNPFILGHRIARPYFCDRIEEQKSLVSAITNGRNTVLISPRRMGKTSLVWLVLNESEEIEDYLTVSFDILQTTSLQEFTYLFGKAVFNALKPHESGMLRGFLSALKSLKGSFGFDPISGMPTFDIQLGDLKNPEYTLDEIFQFIESSEKPVIIVIDEFQQVAKYPEKNTEAVLRSHIQNLSHSTFVFAGSEQSLLQEMFVSSKRPFYNSCEIMNLNPIEEDVYVDFATRLFEDRQRSIEAGAIRWAFKLFDGNTYYMQRTMNSAFGDTAEGEACGMEGVRHSVRTMLAANEVLYREMLSGVSASQKDTLIAIAKEKRVENPTGAQFVKKYSLASSSSVQSALQKLVRRGFIYKAGNAYSLTDPLLRIFINGVYSDSEI